MLVWGLSLGFSGLGFQLMGFRACGVGPSFPSLLRKAIDV